MHIDTSWRNPMSRRPLSVLAAAALLTLANTAFAQSAGEAELARRLDQLAAELAAVKAQLAQLQQQRAAPTPTPPVAAPAPAPVAVAAPAPAEPPATVLSSYGEINYNRPTHASQNAQADLRRFVLGFQHRFDARTKVVTELEVEHSVTSASDPGEVAVEQAYVERQLPPRWAPRAGPFLIPAGVLNANHQPT